MTYMDSVARISSLAGVPASGSPLLLQRLREAARDFWYLIPWEETLDPFPSFYLEPTRLEYREPEVVIPTDFSRLHDTWIVTLHHSGQVDKQQMDLVASQYEDLNYPRYISYRKWDRTFVVNSSLVSYNQLSFIQSSYKKVLPTVSAEADWPLKDTLLDSFTEFFEWYARGKDPRTRNQPAEVLDRASRIEGIPYMTDLQPEVERNFVIDEQF